MSRVSTVDATGARVLDDAINHLERRGITVILSGLGPEQRDVFSVIGSVDQAASQVRSFKTTPEAIEYARKVISPPSRA